MTEAQRHQLYERYRTVVDQSPIVFPLASEMLKPIYDQKGRVIRMVDDNAHAAAIALNLCWEIVNDDLCGTDPDGLYARAKQIIEGLKP